jgi:TfoX/Sxy family transcriptional regulator of competence genes
MAYHQATADRVQNALGQKTDLTSIKMFGGIAFMVRGNMCCGVLDDGLILRLGPELGQQTLILPHTRPFDFTGKPMKSIIKVDSAGFTSDEDLDQWLAMALDFCLGLPPK